MEIILENKGDSVFRCTYVPILEGPHTVYVTFAGQQIPRSPFTVHISEGETNVLFRLIDQIWICFSAKNLLGYLATIFLFLLSSFESFRLDNDEE